MVSPTTTGLPLIGLTLPSSCHNFHTNHVVSETKKHVFNSGGGIKRESYRGGDFKFDDVEDDFKHSRGGRSDKGSFVVNKNDRYLDRGEKRSMTRHSRYGDDDRKPRRHRNREEEFDPFAPKKPVVKRYNEMLGVAVRNKYITDDIDREIEKVQQDRQGRQVPSFFSNPGNKEQPPKAFIVNVTKHIEHHKATKHLREGTHKMHHHGTHAKSTSHSKHAVSHKKETEVKSHKNVDEALSEAIGDDHYLDLNESEVLANLKRLRTAEEIVDTIENSDEKINFEEIKLSPEENRARLQTFYFSTLPEYIEECLLLKLKDEDKMSDEVYYNYLGIERIFVTLVKLSEDYQTITLNYRLLARENVDEMNEEAYKRDAQAIEKLFEREFSKFVLDKFEEKHGQFMLRDFEKSKQIKLNYRGPQVEQPGLFKQKIEVIPGQRRKHINPFADLPYFSGKPFSGEKILKQLKDLGVTFDDSDFFASEKKTK